MLITGGWAKNSFLMNCFRQYLPAQVEIDIPNENLIEYKEAIVFALLGVLRSRGEVNTLHTVTGASRSESGGLVFYPANVGMALPDSRLMAF